MSYPKEIYDKRGVPILHGDLIRTFSFVGPRRRKHYIYHIIVDCGNYMRMRHYRGFLSEEDPGDGSPIISNSIAFDLSRNSEVIAGRGTKPGEDFNDRKKRKTSGVKHEN